jgi:hypothetical protein
MLEVWKMTEGVARASEKDRGNATSVGAMMASDADGPPKKSPQRREAQDGGGRKSRVMEDPEPRKMRDRVGRRSAAWMHASLMVAGIRRWLGGKCWAGDARVPEKSRWRRRQTPGGQAPCLAGRVLVAEAARTREPVGYAQRAARWP